MTNCRRVTAGEVKEFFDKPLQFHVDAQYFGPDRLSINFWTPLMACGRLAPGLKVVLLGVEETKAYLEFSERGYEPAEDDIHFMSNFHCAKMQHSNLEKNDLLRFIWTPEFEKGDILAFSNFTMHGTHYAPEMKEARSSVEVRVDLLGARYTRQASPNGFESLPAAATAVGETQQGQRRAKGAGFAAAGGS